MWTFKPHWSRLYPLLACQSESMARSLIAIVIFFNRSSDLVLYGRGVLYDIICVELGHKWVHWRHLTLENFIWVISLRNPISGSNEVLLIVILRPFTTSQTILLCLCLCSDLIGSSSNHQCSCFLFNLVCLDKWTTSCLPGSDIQSISGIVNASAAAMPGPFWPSSCVEIRQVGIKITGKLGLVTICWELIQFALGWLSLVLLLSTLVVATWGRRRMGLQLLLHLNHLVDFVNELLSEVYLL